MIFFCSDCQFVIEPVFHHCVEKFHYVFLPVLIHTRNEEINFVGLGLRVKMGDINNRFKPPSTVLLLAVPRKKIRFKPPSTVLLIVNRSEKKKKKKKKKKNRFKLKYFIISCSKAIFRYLFLFVLCTSKCSIVLPFHVIKLI